MQLNHKCSHAANQDQGCRMENTRIPLCSLQTRNEARARVETGPGWGGRGRYSWMETAGYRIETWLSWRVGERGKVGSEGGIMNKNGQSYGCTVVKVSWGPSMSLVSVLAPVEQLLTNGTVKPDALCD